MATTATTPNLPPGYTLHTGYPPVAEYRHLRSASGLTPVTESQAAAVASGSWYGCYVTFGAGEAAVVAMGRVIGDGAWYFVVADMAVLPGHQRRGLGAAVLAELVARIREHAPEGDPYVSLLADPPGRRLYLANGFVEAAPAEMGMVLPNEWRRG